MVDGFDVTFQLGPDVLLKRYFKEIADANTRLELRFGKRHTQEHNIYNSILFGPDKVCWPDQFSRAACWAVPDSPLPSDAFGPLTDVVLGDMLHARPRWLNSGTIIGPVAELRDMFRATQAKINKTWDPDYVLHNSDQLYFADLWADQEYMRTKSLGDIPEAKAGGDIEDKNLPIIEQGVGIEYHIGLDYRSSLFQTVAGYEDYLTWTTHLHPFTPNQLAVEPWRAPIDDDVLESSKPFAAIRDDKRLSRTSWRDVSLGVNTVTNQAFPILHFTNDKSLRAEWWPRMWYHESAERLQRAATQMYNKIISEELIGGTRWLKNEPFSSAEHSSEEKSGAWSDQGERLPWSQLCQAHEKSLYERKR